MITGPAGGPASVGLIWICSQAQPAFSVITPAVPPSHSPPLGLTLPQTQGALGLPFAQAPVPGIS